MEKSTKSEVIVPEIVERRILWIRGLKVMLDSHLAELYGVPTKRLNEQVSRNRRRFPDDFMFQLTGDEYESLRSQFATLKTGRGTHRKYLPYVFTEQGVAMLSSVLNSERAILVNIEIMRAFVRLREILSTHKDLARKLEELENKYDSQFQIVFQAMKKLMAPPDPPKRRIGFVVEEPKAFYKVSKKKSASK
ncbi:MAG: ORF6N domain-containing protein [Ignavibacteriae bacterium]|nr:ORF6N domain-containing protein [Ignavibacteriota bacterium]